MYGMRMKLDIHMVTYYLNVVHFIDKQGSKFKFCLKNGLNCLILSGRNSTIKVSENKLTTKLAILSHLCKLLG